MGAFEQSAQEQRGLIAGFMTAVGLLTRIPVGATADPGVPPGSAGWAFPLVGAGIGAIAAFVFLFVQLIGLADWAAALLAVLAGVLLTGALHEDGLADAADGLFGGNDRGQRLAIMRDSRHGTFAVLALILSISLRAAALAQIGEVMFAGLALVAAHAGSRALLPVAMWILPPAREDGLGATSGRPRPVQAIAAVLIAVAICATALGPLRGGSALGLAAATAALAAVISQRRIGGFTGDVLGALQQIGEIVILLAAATMR